MADDLENALGMDRRTFVTSAAAALLSVVAPAGVQDAMAAAGAVTADPSFAAGPGPIRLFVEESWGDTLALDVPFDHEEPRIWSRREVYANEYGEAEFEPDGELTGDALEHAWERYTEDADPSRAGTAVDLDDAGFLAHLDEPDIDGPDRDGSPMWEEFVRTTSPSARAFTWFERILERLTPERRQQLEDEAGVWLRDDEIGRVVHVDPERIDVLQALFDEVGLSVEIKRI
jgi:hypothetical protein